MKGKFYIKDDELKEAVKKIVKRNISEWIEEETMVLRNHNLRIMKLEEELKKEEKK